MLTQVTYMLTCATVCWGATPSSAPSSEASAAPAATQPADRESAPPSDDEKQWWEASRLTADWGGVRSQMEAAGIGTHIFYNSHFMSVMGGGQKTDSGKHSLTADLILTFDLDRMGLINDADVLVHARHQTGRSVNPWTGSSQQIADDADGDRAIYVDQLWYRQFFLDHKISLQVGYLDFQTIIDRNKYANSEDIWFMNAALDNNPLIPSAAATGLGAALTIRPCSWYTLTVGGADAQRVLYKPGFSTTFHDEAWFLAWVENEFHVKIPTDRGPLPGNYRIGLVYDPTERDVFVSPRARPRQRGDDVGLYLSLDQMIFREGDGDSQGLGAFFRYAYRHDDVSRFARFWSTGLAYTGLLPARNKDVLGFAVWQQQGSDRFRRRVNPDFDDETGYELYYAIAVTPWLVITPDVQYIDNPGADGTIRHTIAGGVRVRVKF